MICGSWCALDTADFDQFALLCRTSSPDISVEPSSVTISAPPSGIPRCNSAGSPAADERTGRILSADNTVHAAGELAPVAVPLDFRNGLLDSREGPWEVTTPRSSCPGEECVLSGALQTYSLRQFLRLQGAGDVFTMGWIRHTG